MAGLYLHIPFCPTRCIYCDFYSSTDRRWLTRYVSALCRELEARRDYLGGEALHTVYFGGGTPSVLPIEALHTLFAAIDRIYGLSACEEITLEANPDDLDDNYVRGLSSLPVGRVSLGVQTFSDPLLHLLRRRHTALQAVEAVRRLRRAGFSNLSIDLIYGLPGQTSDQLSADLRQAVDLGVEHLSAYHLTYEEGTALWRMRQKGLVAEADEETSVTLFDCLVDTLSRAGYEHYEISNFCLPGRHSRHNSAYWDGTPYLGCGAAAHSFDGCASRQWNVSSVQAYVEGWEAGGAAFEVETLSPAERYNDYVLTALRTRRGLRLDRLAQFGPSFVRHCLACAEPHVARGLLQAEEGRLHLTRAGIFVSDGIIADLIWAD
ncbi:MAG: radical SAM family heme chaperone HemW [Bacteroidaceae bacterium]